jgi:hypothetical protein
MVVNVRHGTQMDEQLGRQHDAVEAYSVRERTP